MKKKMVGREILPGFVAHVATDVSPETLEALQEMGRCLMAMVEKGKPMNEIDRHVLKYDRPHVYSCTCGIVQMIFIHGDKVDEKILEWPKAPIRYLPCGHAECARGSSGVCGICVESAA